MNNFFLNLNLKKIKDNIVKWKKDFFLETNKNKISCDNTGFLSLYSIFDVINNKNIYNMPGESPFMRGIHASMYRNKKWTIRQYGGFGSSEETNEYYHNCLKKGQKGLSIAFDLPTHRGIDSNDPSALGDIGRTGVAVDSIIDMKKIFKGIPLDKISVSMTMNGAVLPILGGYIAAAEEMGFRKENLRGTIQNDILKEFIVRNTYIYPPEASMRIVGDVIVYLSKNMPKFNSISVSGYHFQESGADLPLELGLTIANGIEYVKLAIKRGLNVDEFAPRISFFFAIGMNFYMEIAKLRAARLLWSNVMDQFNPKKLKSKMLRTHCQTSGWSLSAQEPYNNIIRTTIEAMASVFGGTQSLHTNAFDEAQGLPTDYSAKIARNTQLILQHETGIPNIIDPWGGSYAMEALTQKIYNESLLVIKKIQEYGGPIQASNIGLQKKWILEHAIKRQAKIDSLEEVIIGVNKYSYDKSITSKNKNILRSIDGDKVRLQQINTIKNLYITRNSNNHKQALKQLKNCAQNNQGNLLEESINAMKAKATVGEISNVLSDVFGKHSIEINTIVGVYKSNYKNKDDFIKVHEKVSNFELKYGRRPRILLTKIGHDGHDRGLIVIASGLSDMGFDVDLSPLFQSIEKIVKDAIENDVHVLGVSTLSGAHLELMPLLLKKLNKSNNNINVIMGGIIPEDDIKYLKSINVKGVFAPNVSILKIAINIISIIEESYCE